MCEDERLYVFIKNVDVVVLITRIGSLTRVCYYSGTVLLLEKPAK